MSLSSPKGKVLATDKGHQDSNKSSARTRSTQNTPKAKMQIRLGTSGISSKLNKGVLMLCHY